MRSLLAINKRTAIIATATLATALLLAASPAKPKCAHSFCGPKSHKITDKHGRKTGDIYDPGHGRRLQIRDKHRRIRGYVERDGTITNRHRQKVGAIKLD